MTTTEEPLPGVVEVPSAAMEGAGARLRAAREAAGLSLDQVAQQLKLAPRQVKALEDEDFSALPGRTFSRGFARNYARLLNLDPEDLLLHLPDVAHAPALGSPALHSTGAMMAELPNTMAVKPNIARWLIPLVLVACIIAAAAYEWYRGGLASLGESPRSSVPAKELRTGSSTVTSLSNPLASEGRPATSVAPVIADEKAPPPSNASVSAPAAATTQPTAPSAEPLAADAPLVLSYAGPSWTEIRDHSGQLLVSRLIGAHSVEPVRGEPPFEVVLGNATVVTLSYRGKAIDLAQYTRHNVARLTLQ